MRLVSTEDPNALAPVLVMDRYAPGFDRIDGESAVNRDGVKVPEWKALTFRQAFDEEQARDAHFVLYNAIAHDGSIAQACPRMTKPGLVSFVHDHQLANDVVGCYLGLDYDLPNHQPWSDTMLPLVEGMLIAAGERNVLFRHPTVCYRTKGGFRLVWALTDPIKLEGRSGLEDHLRGLVGDAFIAGVPVDSSCRDWTRLFRLPCVRRRNDDGSIHQTSKESYFSISYNRCDLRAQDDCPEQVVAYVPCF